MSLRIWLPMTKDTRNQGLCGDVLTESGVSFTDGGKLGGKYFSAGTITIPASSSNSIFNGTHMSFSFWLKPIGTSGTNVIFGQSSMSVGNNRMYSIFQYPTPNDLHISWQSETSSSTFISFTISGFFEADKWTHCALIYDGSKLLVYKNGILNGTYNGVNTRTAFNYDYPISGSSIRCLNDFRIYDHCLSALEVKRLSQGLVLHYPLNRGGWGQENLLKYTKVNATNQNLLKTNITSSWGKLTLTTKDGYDCYLYPSAQSSTWFASGQWYSSMKADTTYTYTAWIYFTADANFNFTSLGHFQVYNSESTASDKAHEDVVSARIYEPSTIVANTWTKVRITFTTNNLANSYFVIYPRYNIAANTGDLYFRDCKLEEGSIATPWCPNSSDELATKMGMNDGIEYDCSGFGNNGEKTTTINYSSNSARYMVSYEFNSTDRSNIYFPNEANPSEEISISLWGYKNNWNVAERLAGKAASSSGWCIGDYGSENTMFGFFLQSGSGGYNTISGFRQLSSGWHHFVITFDGYNLKYYLDGECISTKTWESKQKLQVGTGKYNIGSHTNNSYFFNGNMSDFRIYATALSASDVLSLYQNSAYIDNSGNVYGAVHEEV